ncbi:MAG: HAD-IIA family hydrolase [Actinomycetota bacterium]
MALVDRYPVLLLDLDGTIVRGDEPIPGAAEAIAGVREHGSRIAFVTNNATRAPDDVARHLARAGVQADPAEVVTSAIATAETLAARAVRSACVIGETALRASLQAAGIEVRDASSDGSAVDVVVVGLDRDTTYADLRVAAEQVQRGATLVATNSDTSYPVPGGVAPGAGALLAVIEATTGSRAEVIGKPHPALLEAAVAATGGGGPVLVVGDRLDTDVAGAVGLGWDSLLVLTGVSTQEEVRASPVIPTYVAQTLGALLSDPEPDRVVRPDRRPA